MMQRFDCVTQVSKSIELSRLRFSQTNKLQTKNKLRRIACCVPRTLVHKRIAPFHTPLQFLHDACRAAVTEIATARVAYQGQGLRPFSLYWLCIRPVLYWRECYS